MKFDAEDPLISDTTVKISRQGNLATRIYAPLVQKFIHSAVSRKTGA
jgi:hypothetical protein